MYLACIKSRSFPSVKGINDRAQLSFPILSGKNDERGTTFPPVKQVEINVLVEANLS